MDADGGGPLQPISANVVLSQQHQQPTKEQQQQQQQQPPHEHAQSLSSLSTSSAVSSSASGRRDSTSTTTTTTSSPRQSLPSSSVGDKISQFNTLAMQSRLLERKTADAALKRAMLGREEAESEMRRYREEAHALRKAIGESTERERRVGERLEAVMENYNRAKETHAHTQLLWEKETRRARKDIYKAQSAHIKVQAELKASREALQSIEEALEKEKERSRAREQEVFAARYEIVGVQEQLEHALARVAAAEQERDSLRALAQNQEEVARIAAEGFGQQQQHSSLRECSPAPQPLGVVHSSTAAEVEIEELTTMLEWERRRADRALDMVDFLETECRMHACSGSKPGRSRSVASARRRTNGPEIADPSDLAILREKREVSSTPAGSPRAPSSVLGAPVPVSVSVGSRRSQSPDDRLRVPKAKKIKTERTEDRRSTIFCAREGIFRTVSQQEAAEIELRDRQAAAAPASSSSSPPQPPPPPSSSSEGRGLDLDVRTYSTTITTATAGAPPLVSLPPIHLFDRDADTGSRSYTRSPSVEPPAFAMTTQQRMSLQSLLNAPHETDHHHNHPLSQSVLSQIPTVSVSASSFRSRTATDPIPEEAPQPPSPEKKGTFTNGKGTNGFGKRPHPDSVHSPNHDCRHDSHYDSHYSSHYDQENVAPDGGGRPHTSTSFYRVTTTTTSVPLRSDAPSSLAAPGVPPRPFSALNNGFRAASGSSALSFDADDPAYGPTMTREEALAQIRERRGRTRSAALGNMTPRRKMLAGVGEAGRNVSAPAGRVGAAAKRP